MTELRQFDNFTKESLIAFAFYKGVISKEELRAYLFNMNSNGSTPKGHMFSLQKGIQD